MKINRFRFSLKTIFIILILLNLSTFIVYANTEKLTQNGYGNYVIGSKMNNIQDMLKNNNIKYKIDESRSYVSIKFKEKLFDKDWDLALIFNLESKIIKRLSFSRFTVQDFDSSTYRIQVESCETEFNDILKILSQTLQSKPKVIKEDRFQNSDTYQWKFSNGSYIELIHSCELGPYLIRLDFEFESKK